MIVRLASQSIFMNKTNQALENMKNTLIIVALLLAVVCSCNKSPNYIYYQSNKATFYVKDLRTNDSMWNVNNQALSMLDTLEVNRNDNLLLVYQAPENYVDSKFTIMFKAFGEEYSIKSVAGNQPYQLIVVVNSILADSSYLIQCDAFSEEWMEGSYDKGYVMVHVSE